ncbi:MAG TPA: response regulator transcription factor [Dehalococcoidia bacterium]|nr:response regulator transcription factor [Dehalococcoidia bacterium]
MEQISVFLADWQVLFREGIHFTLSGEEDLVVTGEATSNAEALDLILKNPPRIAIININHGDFSGVNLTLSIRQNLPSVSVVLVIDTDDINHRYSALKCGAAACITKDIGPEELVNLVRKIADGNDLMSQVILRPDIADRIIEDFNNFNLMNSEVHNLLASLSTRESEILSNISDGHTPGEIASALGISDESVTKSLGIIRQKLETNERSRAIVEASQKALTSGKEKTESDTSSQEYITREEFNAFKESLKEHFRAFTDNYMDFK